jgi:bacillithiol biosynthesis cysteine-adding enzyme BshC
MPDPVLPYDGFRHPPSPLFRAYLGGRVEAAPFFAAEGWEPAALVRSAETTGAGERPRQIVARALAARQRGAAAAACAEALADPETVAVVTGQQAVLFGGPLYVLYKALAAVKLAAWLQARRGRPVVPVFWVASDDHDFAEIRAATVLDDAGRLRTLRYSPAHEPGGRPASHIALDESVLALARELEQALPAGIHRDDALSAVRESYRPGRSMSEAFGGLLASFLPELVLLDPSDRALKAAMGPVLAREIREGSPTSRLAAAVGARLLAAGFHQQVPVRSGFLNLFVVMEGERRALAVDGDRVEVRGLGRQLPVSEAERRLLAAPEDWSPGVLLRPLAQDFLLPTAAYVGGPAEIAYHAQIGDSYAHFGIPRPALVPRPSLTLVEPAQARALEAEGLSLADLQADPEGVISRWARAAYPEVEAAFDRARRAVEREISGVEERLAALDPTLAAAAQSARGRVLHQVETLYEKSLRALKKKDQARAERLRRTRDALLPGGSFQERGLGWIGLLARHGRAIIGEVMERMDPWAKGHQVIDL